VFGGLLVTFACAIGLVVAAQLESDLHTLITKEGSDLDLQLHYYESHTSPGYGTALELIDAAPTGKDNNALSKDNLLQWWAFMSETNLLGLSVKIGGSSDVTLSGMTALSMAAPVAPSRYTVLDCWQEGSFDFFANLDGLLGKCAVAVDLGGHGPGEMLWL
jgi:hypothetical protein